MIEIIKQKPSLTLEDYSAVAHLSGAVQELRDEAATLLPRMRGRSVLMVNSTSKGGGVAEMMPRMVLILRELGINAEWAVMHPKVPEFFRLTKRLHNLIHGEGDPNLETGDRAMYEDVNREVADGLRKHVTPDDLLVIHDPQPLAAGAFLKKEIKVRTIWRCHVGLDEDLPATRAAWGFLRPYAEIYDKTIFSAPEYIPDYLAGRASVIHPGIDPLGHKNRVLPPHKLVGILCNAGLARPHSPLLTPAFEHQAKRLQPDGKFAPATEPDEIGLLYRPIVTQISRWDRLKGWQPLLEGFVQLKHRLKKGGPVLEERHRRRLEIARLVLAGPDPASVQDDPEGREVFQKLRDFYCGLEPDIQKDVVVLSLPMDSRKENELMVNALQRCATIVAQNSLREGFGLTATEAMWKAVPVMGTDACGLRQQIRDGIDGRLNPEPENPDKVAELLDEMLGNVPNRERWGRNAQKRVHTEFLVFAQIHRWLRLLADCAEPRASAHRSAPPTPMRIQSP